MRGPKWSDDPVSGERILMDNRLELIEKLKEENRPYVIRYFLFQYRINFPSTCDERMELKKEKR